MKDQSRRVGESLVLLASLGLGWSSLARAQASDTGAATDRAARLRLQQRGHDE